MSPETRQQALAKLHAIVNKIGYPDKWRDYSISKSRAATLRATCAAAPFRIQARLGEDRQTPRPWRVANDSTHRKRLLRSADE